MKDPKDPVTVYARRVVAGRRIIAGRLVRLACERHLRDLRLGGKRGLRWNIDAAQFAIGFFRDVLQLAEGAHAGEPFVLQPWQQFIVGSLFGWQTVDGARRFRTAYVETGKGNGKTPMAAGIGLLGLTADNEAGAQVFAAAVTREQAGILFLDAERMVQASPELAERVLPNVGNLAHVESGSFFRPVSSEARSLDGKRVHMALIDELHEHPSADVVDKMRAGTKGRRQALIFEITNAGYDRHSVCYQHHVLSQQVLEGAVENDSWFAFVCDLDEGDDWRDERVWAKANPNLGVSITLQYLREQVQEAESMPAKQNLVRRLNFCEWTEQAERWIDVALWDAVDQSVDEPALQGRACFAGLDLSSTTDLTALALLFPPAHAGERWQVVMRYWLPEDNLRRRVEQDRVPYHVWKAQGFLRTTPGNVVDKDFIEVQIKADAQRFRIRELVYDRFLADQLITHLQGEGMTVVPFGQGFVSMTAPCAQFETLVLGRQLAHGRHPVLRWNVANVAVRQDPAGNRKPDKDRSTERIDGVVALLMALGRAIVAAPEPSRRWLVIR